MRVRRARRVGALAGTVVAAVVLAAVPGSAGAAGSGAAAGAALSATTAAGVHNAYEKGTFTYFVDALDSGAALVELDVWADSLSRRWRVSHSNPFGNDNNCEYADSPEELRGQVRNQDLGSCLDNIRAWHDANPGHRPIVFKVEFKSGFNNRAGLGPDEFDALVRGKLGDMVFTPARLMAGGHATPDDAARAGAWPSREALAGTVMFEVIPGTVEQSNPTDTLWTDVEYARHLRAAPSTAQAFPTVLGAEAGDPRTRYSDTSLRPWFVVFDGSAGSYAAGGIDTSWYARNNYLLVMTGAHSVAPAIDAYNPTEQQALDRLALLAGRHASFATSDWSSLRPEVLGTVLPRG